MSEIYLIRHGQASFGAQNYDRLSPVGERQAAVLAAHLDQYEISFDAFYAGQLERQLKTAQPVCERYAGRAPHLAAPTIRTAFDEYSSEPVLMARLESDPPAESTGENPMDTLRNDRRAFQVYFSEAVHQWTAGKFDGVPGVEPWKTFCQRVETGLQDIMQRHGRNQRVAIFTSGGPISAILQTALGLSNRVTIELSWQVMNASLTCLKYNTRGMALSFFNNVSHLLIAKDDSLLTYR